jgi:hypothetical protein
VSIRYLLADPSRDPCFPLRVRVQQEIMSHDVSPHEDVSHREDVSHHEDPLQARLEVYSVGYSVENAFRGSSSTFDGKDGGGGEGGGVRD